MRKTKTKGKPCEIDVYVGQRIRQARAETAMSQEKLAEALDLTFQQVQKYEKGTNRVSAGRLAQISNIFDYPISWFFPEKYREDDRKYNHIIENQAARLLITEFRLNKIIEIAGAK